MAKKDERFVRVYSQGSGLGMHIQIWVDRVTGVNYIYHQSGYSGGLTPLLDKDGNVADFLMNDKCAAGTGRFLEVMANILCLDINDLGAIAAKSDKPAPISSTCTVFAESEVISQMANGVEQADLVAGICQSVATRVAALARRAGITQRVCMSGGVARNEAVRRYMAEALNTEISFDPRAQYFGAIGAALYAWRQADQVYSGNF